MAAQYPWRLATDRRTGASNVTSELNFRTAGPADVPALVTLVESAYRGEASRAGWTSEADLLDGRRTDAELVADVIAREGSVILLAERDGELLACCQLERRADTAYFGLFSVRPERQGGGLGREVLSRAERLAREEWGAAELEMTVIEQRADLIAWYERRGYHRTGDYSPFPYGDERFGVPRRADLRFERLTKAL
ncbi:GNAT family N-acetyltransferase [Kitasatospora sp. NPDC088346]|uniref:GNAT family N-acetyltransferase n=1 Tax=Kitasatospora sp. NPDC088346 TaxID=3364073 RepID=UPI0037F77657